LRDSIKGLISFYLGIEHSVFYSVLESYCWLNYLNIWKILL